MSPTLDETATTDDPQVRRDHRAALLFRALYRAIEFDGLPAPRIVLPGIGLPVKLQMSTAADVDDWAVCLDVPVELEDHVYDGPPPWRMYRAAGALEGVEIEIWAPDPMPTGDAL